MAERGVARRAALTGLERYFEVSLFLLVATSVLTVVSTGKLDALSTFVPPVALIIKALRYRRGCGPELSHRAATWLVVAYFFFFPVDLWFISRALAIGAPNPGLYATLLATIHLMLFALLVRLFSARTTRDHLFLAMVAFAMILVAAILTVDTTFLVFFLIFLVLAVSTFVGLEMRRSAEGAVSPPLETGTAAARRLHRALSVTSGVVAFSALVLGTILFFIIPRFTAGYLSGLNLQPALISGFSDNVELGQIGRIKQNTAVVMRVRVEGGPERARGVRWRGIALTNFDGRRWFTDEHEPVAITPGYQGWYEVWGAGTRSLAGFTSLRYTVLLEPLATDAIFVAHEALAVRGRFSPEIGRFGQPSRRSYLWRDKTASLRNPFYNYTKILYEGRSLLQNFAPQQLRASREEYSPAIRQTYLQLPSVDARITELAKQITAQAPTAYDRAVAIESYLRTRFGYTLELPSPAPEDPLAHFLFERRAGHCEYFAAAMTVMLRAQGIPARYVNGFLPGEYNDVGKDFIVRASDAHSWVEVYFPEQGWVAFDPTPPSEERPQSWLGRLALYWDWFELMWNEWVINYDFIHQVTLAQNFQRASREWSERARRYMQVKRRQVVNALKEWQARVVGVAGAASGAVGVVIGLALVTLVVLLRSRTLREYLAALAASWGLRIAPRAELTPRLATLHYERMLWMLARRGLHKAVGQTPREFLAAIPQDALAAPVGELTELYQSARFGAARADAQQMSALLDAIKAVLRSIPRLR